MKTEILQTKDLIPYKRNNKVHSESQIKELAKSIQEYGFIQPMVVDKNNEVIIGHARLDAIKMLEKEGLRNKGVEVVRLSELTEKQVRKLRLLDNKISDMADRDLENMRFEVEEIGDEEFSRLFDFDEMYKKQNINFDEIDINDLSMDDGEDVRDVSKYTKKIEAPIYEPTGKNRSVGELYDIEKYDALVREIENSNVGGDVKKFLIATASRHIVFNYERIADFYAEQNKEIQELMEKLCLVIIDFEKAIEEGYVQVSEDILSEYNKDAK